MNPGESTLGSMHLFTVTLSFVWLQSSSENEGQICWKFNITGPRKFVLINQKRGKVYPSEPVFLLVKYEITTILTLFHT